MNDILRSRVIRTPEELAEIVRDLKRAIAAGQIQQVLPDSSPFATDVVLQDVPDDGPWPDYLELRFRVSGATNIYKLSVETYHGHGGTWKQEE